MHYSATIETLVLEVYPLIKSQTETDKNLRLGFGIYNFDETVQKLKELEVAFSLEPTKTNYGFITIISDPNDRKIKLYKK